MTETTDKRTKFPTRDERLNRYAAAVRSVITARDDYRPPARPDEFCAAIAAVVLDMADLDVGLALQIENEHGDHSATALRTLEAS